MLLGAGDGRFGDVAKFSADALPSAIAAADFNSDGKLDLATANEDSSNVSILLGTGTGNFNAATNFSGMFRPASIATGDFNGDGKLDLATAGTFLNILPGDGAGGFGSAVRIDNVGASPTSVVTGDFNKDGRADLAVSTYINTSNMVRVVGHIAVLLANNSGGFDDPLVVELEQVKPSRLLTSDLNNDGKPDLLGVTNDPSSIIPLIGDGAGGFAAARSYATPFQPVQSINADFTGDGKLDLLTLGGTCEATNCANNGSAQMRAGDGDGGFGAAAEFTVGNNPVAMAIGDFNNDNRPDVASANRGSNNVSILLNNGNGGLAAVTNIAVSENPQAIVAGDFNNDGKSDLVVTHVTPTLNQVITVLLGDGAGGFAPRRRSIPTSPSSLWSWPM